MEMLEEVSRASDPQEAVEVFSRRMWRLRPIDRLVTVSVRGLPKGEYKITRQYRRDVNGDRVNLTPDVNPWRDWDRLPSYTGGFIGEIIARGEARLLSDLEIRNDPALGDSVADMASCLVTPSFDAGEPLNWSFHFRREPDGYNDEDLEQSLLVGNLFGSMTKNLVSLQHIQRLNAALRQQFEDVARIQQSLLPARLPEIPRLAIATSYLTSEQAGGDYYDFFPLPDGKWGILIADVSGHGAGAATVMAMLHAILHTYPTRSTGHDAPHQVMKYANARLVASHMERSFITALYGIFDPRDLTFTYCRAGHPQPRVKDTNTGRVWALQDAGALPLGITDEFEAESEVARLRVGETLVLYTDGITEEFNAAREMFGVEGLDGALNLCSGEPDCVVDTVHAALFRHTNRRSRADDQTLVVLKVTE